MAINQTKDVDQREWPLTDADGERTVLRVTHTTVVKDVGLPSESTEHVWEAEMQRAKVRVLCAFADTEANMDAALNIWRQAIVDARATLPAMA